MSKCVSVLNDLLNKIITLLTTVSFIHFFSWNQCFMWAETRCPPAFCEQNEGLNIVETAEFSLTVINKSLFLVYDHHEGIPLFLLLFLLLLYE